MTPSHLMHSGDERWEKIQHPFGWTYYFHASERIVASERARVVLPEQGLAQYEEFWWLPPSGLNTKIPDNGSLRRVNHLEATVSDSDMKPGDRAQLMYWEYMLEYPSHHNSRSKEVIRSMEEGKRDAVKYLQWCWHGTLSAQKTLLG